MGPAPAPRTRDGPNHHPAPGSRTRDGPNHHPAPGPRTRDGPNHHHHHHHHHKIDLGFQGRSFPQHESRDTLVFKGSVSCVTYLRSNWCLSEFARPRIIVPCVQFSLPLLFLAAPSTLHSRLLYQTWSS